jgi:hypothetical protein
MTTEQSLTRPLDAALDYAARGWPVFPCHSIHAGSCTCYRAECSSPGKHPRIGGGLTAATTDVDTIQRWWRRWPTANIAIRTGAPSRLVVVDIDPDHGGATTLRQLVRRHGELPSAPTVRTGSGGTHLFFAHPGERVGNSAGALGAGIDIRGDGGYVIAPPSRHVSGATYRWERGDVALPASPSWIVADTREPLRREPSRGEPIRIDRAIHAWARAALEDEAARVRGARPGTRNNTLNRAAFSLGQIIGAGLLDADTVEHTLAGSAMTAGLTEHEARQTIRSGLGAGTGQPRGPRHTPEAFSVHGASKPDLEVEIDITDTR